MIVLVDPNHPLLKFKKALPWQQLHDIAISAWREAGKNVDGRRGRKWDTWLYLRIIMIEQVKDLQNKIDKIICSIKDSTDKTDVAARKKLKDMQEVAHTLVPQILHWLTTGTVGKGNIFPSVVTQAQSIVKNKVGKILVALQFGDLSRKL